MVLLAFLPVWGQGQSNRHTIREDTFFQEHTFRGQVKALEETPVLNPINWPSVIWHVADGEWVEKGDTLIEIDQDQFAQQLKQQRLQVAITSATLRREVGRNRNDTAALRDELEQLQDQEALLQAKWQRYRALPQEDDVRIAQGRLKVARLNAQAAREDFSKGEERFSRGMISQGRLDEFSEKWEKAEARLAFALAEAEYTALPATTHTLRIIELQRENVQLEIGKVQKELAKTDRLLELEAQSARARSQRMEQEIREREEDLEKTTVKAPVSGYAVHTRSFKDRMSGEAKFWKNFIFMTIPNRETLTIQGTIPEDMGGHFSKGNPARVWVSGRMDEPLEGRILQFSRMPRDLADRADQDFEWGGTESETGIKVFDVTVKLEDAPRWVRPGMHALCDLISTRSLTAPAAPLGFVRKEGEKHFLARDGVYEPVEGQAVRGWFLLKDEEWIGKEITLFGRFPGEMNREKATQPVGRFSASGELAPLLTREVFVQELLGGWRNMPQVTWLAPEDGWVSKGDEVVRLDTKNAEERIQEQTLKVEEVSSDRQKQEEEKAIVEEENRFQLAKLANELEIARLEREIVEQGRNWTAIFQARLNLSQAEIEEKYIRRRLERISGKKQSAYSPQEIQRLERDLERALLKREQAEIRLKRQTDGAEALELSRARLDEKNKEYQVLRQRLKAEKDRFQYEQNLKKTLLDETRERRRLEEMERLRENYVLRAPADGLVRYQKIMNTDGFKKVKVGSLVGERFVPIIIADVSRMFIRVEVPEHYASQVREGMEVEVVLPGEGRRKLKGTVSEVEFLFEERRRADQDVGMYSSREPLGETVFHVRVALPALEQKTLKPGTVADVLFPFDR